MKHIHGVALGLALDGDELQGLLILGASGAGKSALAAELIAHCPFGRTGLIADDLVRLTPKGDALPAEGGPLLHLRGLGIARVRSSPALPIRWVLAAKGGVSAAVPRAQQIDVDGLPNASSLRLLLTSLASGESMWCGFEPGP